MNIEYKRLEMDGMSSHPTKPGKSAFSHDEREAWMRLCLCKVFECVHQVLMVNNQILWWTDREMSSSFFPCLSYKAFMIVMDCVKSDCKSMDDMAYNVSQHSQYLRKRKEWREKRTQVCKWYMDFTMSVIRHCFSHYSAVFKQQNCCLPPVGNYLFNLSKTDFI